MKLPNINELAAAVADRVAEIVAARIEAAVEARIMAKLEPRLQAMSARILTQSAVTAEHHAHSMREEILGGCGETPDQKRAKRAAAAWGLDKS